MEGCDRMAATIEQVKRQLESIKDTDVRVKVNRGRKKTGVFDGKIKSIYSNIFTMQVYEPTGAALVSYSYGDVLTNNVVISPIK